MGGLLMVEQGLLGFKGQGLSVGTGATASLIGTIIQGRSQDSNFALTGSLVLPEDALADIFAYGAGASGTASSAFPFGGGGGSAGYSRLMLPRGTLVSWSIGPAGISNGPGDTDGKIGGDTTVSFDGVLYATAQGGRRPAGGSAAPRSTAMGFQHNRYGGGSGEPGEQGRLGPSGFNTVFGGGPGGFRDLFGEFASSMGNSANSTPPAVAAYGAGGRCGSDSGYSAYGGSGLFVAFLYRPIL
jgi:hypothetical protein